MALAPSVVVKVAVDVVDAADRLGAAAVAVKAVLADLGDLMVADEDLTPDADGIGHHPNCPVTRTMLVRSSAGRGACTCIPGHTIRRTIPKPVAWAGGRRWYRLEYAPRDDAGVLAYRTRPAGPRNRNGYHLLGQL